jgi:hypothetical protein
MPASLRPLGPQLSADHWRRNSFPRGESQAHTDTAICAAERSIIKGSPFWQTTYEIGSAVAPRSNTHYSGGRGANVKVCGRAGVHRPASGGHGWRGQLANPGGLLTPSNAMYTRFRWVWWPRAAPEPRRPFLLFLSVQMGNALSINPADNVRGTGGPVAGTHWPSTRRRAAVVTRAAFPFGH